MSDTPRPLTLTIAALGGQGGGVVQNWMVEVAEQEGYLVQATSVPGVAQRTGATIYYLEFAVGPDVPIMALMPAPGGCDLVVASELAEATRMVQRRLVDPKVTTLITSSHRAYTIDEKSHLADGRADQAELLSVAREHAARLIAFDMEAIAQAQGSVISACLLGAIAGAGVLPFSAESYRAAIEKSGRGVQASLAAFEAALLATRENTPASEMTQDDQHHHRHGSAEGLDKIVAHAEARLVDYQDVAYADTYKKLLQPFVDADDTPFTLSKHVARGLALWMTYEDTIRVADLKTRPERLRRLLGEQDEGTVVYVADYMKPRLDEIAGSLPVKLGQWLLRSKRAGRLVAWCARGITLRTTSVPGYLLLRLVARLKPVRRRLLRHHEEQAAMHEWLQTIRDLMAVNYDLAVEVAASQELVSGYGETHARGLANCRQIMDLAVTISTQPDAALQVAKLRALALADEDTTELRRAIQSRIDAVEAA